MVENTKKRKQKKRTGLYRNLTYIFCGIIVAFSVISIIIPDKEYSENENRVLAEWPEFSFENIMNGKYMSGLESYISDHFVLRDFWINIKVKSDLLVGKSELNGVYLGDEDYLIQIPADPDMKDVDENLQAINRFAENNPTLNIDMLVVPNAVSVMEKYLPTGAPARDQKEDAKYIKEHLTDKLEYIDVSDVLKKHVSEGMYYKTDHHWTSRAAYYTFLEAAEKLGISEPKTEYDVYTVTTEFTGTLASTSGYHGAEDKIEIYAPADADVDYLVTDSSGGELRTTIYDREALSEKDKYQVFMGGNHAKAEISTVNETQRKLLLIKDSYANCFVSFLLPYYNEIIMVDPRYYYDDIQSLIENQRVTDVLLLYNMDTFMNDKSLADVLAAE